MLPTAWIEATITFATDDDLTPEVDLGAVFKFLMVLIPEINSGTVSIHGVRDKSGSVYPIHHFNDADADGTVLQASTAGTGSIAVLFILGGFQYIKVCTSVAQTANRTFLVRGFN